MLGSQEWQLKFGFYQGRSVDMDVISIFAIRGSDHACVAYSTSKVCLSDNLLESSISPKLIDLDKMFLEYGMS